MKNGSTVILGGNSLRSHPMAMIRQLIRNDVHDLKIVGYVHGIDVDMLAGAGSLKSVAAGDVGFETFGLAPNFRRCVEKGELEVIDYPEIMERFWAAAFDMPFFPNVELFGSDILKYNKEIKEGISPLTGEKYAALPPAHADVTIIHAQMADEYGNILWKARQLMTTEEDVWFTRCSDKVIVTAERIVDNNLVLKNPHLNGCPEYRTDAVVWAPFGAHPCAFDYFYDYDTKHIAFYLEQAKDPETFRRYLDKYVRGPRDHGEYLNLVGPTERLLRLQTAEAFLL